MKIGAVAAAFVLTTCMAVGVSAQTAGPAKQVKKQAVSQDTKAAFACTMHPEVTAAKAGKCTKCGAALAKVDASAAQKHAKHHEAGGKCEGKSIDPCEKGCEEGAEGCAKACGGGEESGCPGKH